MNMVLLGKKKGENRHHKRTTKKANVFHLVVSRGNLECFQELLDWVSPFVYKDLLNEASLKGKTVLDLAAYNAEIAKLIRANGGVNGWAKFMLGGESGGLTAKSGVAKTTDAAGKAVPITAQAERDAKFDELCGGTSAKLWPLS